MQALTDLPQKQLKEMAENNEIASALSGDMSFFPLCCSTGILKNLQAYPWENSTAVKCTSKVPAKDIKAETKVYELLRKYARGFIIPVEWAQDLALSLILEKVTGGKDDGPSGGYNNYKAAQITWFDRLNDDKRSGKRFNHYNVTYSCDHLTEFLSKQAQKEWGQILVSKPVDGAHGARVRGCVYTPNIDYLRAREAEALARIKAEMLGQRKLSGEAEWQIK